MGGKKGTLMIVSFVSPKVTATQRNNKMKQHFKQFMERFSITTINHKDKQVVSKET